MNINKRKNKMTEEQIENIKQYEWDKFCRRYPILTGSFIAKIWLIFSSNIQHLIWENGFLQGWIQANKQGD